MAFFILNVIYNLVAIYVGLGILFVLPFIFWGINQIDISGKGSSILFRIIIIPGTIIFWPYLLSNWSKTLKKGKSNKTKISSQRGM